MCVEIIPKVMGSRNDCIEGIYSKCDDKVMLVTNDTGFLGSVLPRCEAMLPEPASIWYTRSGISE